MMFSQFYVRPLRNKPVRRIAFIGGTGIYNIDSLSIEKEVYFKTPWGFPSGKIVLGTYDNGTNQIPLAFLPRHGIGHTFPPHRIPQRANMAALKMLNVDRIIAFSAVGSLKDKIKPMDFILPDQIIDHTRQRNNTFYDEDITVHISFGEPFDPVIRDVLEKAINYSALPLHKQETLICIEGPALSSRAESKLYKSWGAGIINMTVMPEAKLARELELSYQVVCMSTDYDSWREESVTTSVEEIIQVIKQNSHNAQKLLGNILPFLPLIEQEPNPLQGSIASSILTSMPYRSSKTRKKFNQLFPGTF